MARSLDVSVLVRLVDRLTGPLGALQRRFAQFAALGQRIGILGAAAAAISFMLPIQSAAAFDQQLRDIAVTAGKTGAEAERQIAALGRTYEELALKVGIASVELSKAAGLLIASGMDDVLAERLMPTIGRVSKAASALPDDVAKVAFALTNSLGVAAGDVEIAFAKLITAGKLGRFEFRDMARELPELASQFTKFKISGMEAVETLGASLQVAMFGTDDTRAAANNFKNFLSKVLAPDAVKNFKEMGVDILGVMQSAAAQGINPVEAAIQKVLKLTGVSAKEAMAIFNQKKGQGMTDAQAMAAALEQIKAIAASGNLSQIFGDMQVLDFLLPMLANIEKYTEFKKEIQASGLDVIAQDFATQMAGLTTKMTIFGEIGEQAMRRVGIAFGSNLGWINRWGIAVLQWVQRVDAAFPGLIDLVLSWGGAFLAAVAGLALMSPVLTVLSAAFGALSVIIGLIATPIGVVAAAFAAAAVIIYQNWDEFAGYFTRIWDGVKDVFGGAVDYLTALFSGDFGGMLAGLQRIMDGAGNIVGGIAGHITGLASHMWDALRSFAGDAGAWLEEKLGTELVEKIKAPFDGLLDWFAGLPGRIVGAIGSIDVGSLVKWPSLPSWLGGGEAAPATNGTAAPGAGKVGQLAPASAVARNTQVGGQITVSAAPGTQIESVKSSNPDVPLKTATTGRVVGRV